MTLPDGSEGIDWTDRRKLEDLTFGVVFPEAEREVAAKFTYDMLVLCGVEIAEDISKVGCTGLAIHNLSVGEMKHVRLGIGGSGCPLPCFVPPTRYCLVHETIGGLQEGQAPLFHEMVGEVSRELKPEEKKHVEIVESAARVEARTDAGRMSGARDILMSDGEEDGAAKLFIPESDRTTHTTGVINVVAPWTCPEHGATLWACRFCVAAEIAKGALEPVFLIMGDTETLRAELVATEVEKRSARGDTTVELYVRVARWTRKLARD